MNKKFAKICKRSLILFSASLSLAVQAQERLRPGKSTHILPKEIYEEERGLEESEKDFKVVPDRWRAFYNGSIWDPYNINILKGDIPVFGSQKNPWFLEIGLSSDFLAEGRNVPTPVGGPSTAKAGTYDLLGEGKQYVLSENLLFTLSLYQGNTTFKPQNFEFRVTPVFNATYVRIGEAGVLKVNPARGRARGNFFLGFQELFAEFHLLDLSPRYDFFSSRLGIQKFSSDFRGFVFTSNEPGIRLFGNWDNNFWQYNLAYFRRLNKDTNSGLNTVFEDRHEDVVVANVYRQDALVLGHTLQGSVHYRYDHAGDEPNHFDQNGFLIRPASIGDERPKNISSTYLGVTGDGHWDRLNLNHALYFVFGEETHNPIAGRQVDIRAWMGAAELSYDFDWLRLRGSFFYASGDSDPFDDTAEGFDAIFDQPQFAGGEFSYWNRQGVPFIAGGILPLVGRLSLLPNLRAGKEEGQSNFVNPGIQIYSLGVDIEATPKLRILPNFNFLRFDEVAVLEALRQDGSIDSKIGYDLSLGLLYRPFLNNNVQIKLGGAVLIPEDGFANLFGDELRYQGFSNLILVY